MNLDLQLNTSEVSMMEEVFEVLRRYSGKTREFGLQLIHSHFPMNESEILYETHNSEERTMSVSPVNVAEVNPSALVTAWQFNEKGQIVAAQICCSTGTEVGTGK